MSLALDARQRAMLEEMGVKVWWPEAPVPALAAGGATKTIASTLEGMGAAAASDARMPGAAGATDAAAAAGASGAGRAPAGRTGASPPAGASPEPGAAVSPMAAASPADAPCDGPAVRLDAARRLYDGRGAAQGGWLVVADMPPGSDGRHGAPFAGDAGRLLDQMLRALRLHKGDVPVHLVRTHRAATGTATTEPADGPPPHALADSFAALAPRIVLALGPLAAQALLARAEPLGKLRGRVLQAAAAPGVPVVASYAPAYLLRHCADKARAWADLCLAAEAAEGVGGG